MDTILLTFCRTCTNIRINRTKFIVLKGRYIVSCFSFRLFLLNDFYRYGAKEGCSNDGTLVKLPSILNKILKLLFYVNMCLSLNLFSIVVSLYKPKFYTLFKCVPFL
jgi:hypothetical protein